MCLVLDANMFGPFLNHDNKDLRPIHHWLINKRGKIVYTDYSRYQKELNESMRLWLESRTKVGQAKFVDQKAVTKENSALQHEHKKGALVLKSNDVHILALARASKARLLCSQDKKLHIDFTNPQIIKGGKIYQTQAHRALLSQDACP